MLNMGSNRLASLTDGVFQGLGTLTHLSLEKNDIAYISPLAFQPLVSLQTLAMHYNPLKHAADIAPILRLPNLYELVLAFTEFTVFDSDQLRLNRSNLRYLSLSADLLTRFSLRRDIFPRLQRLLLSTDDRFEWDVPDAAFLRTLTALELIVSGVGKETFTKMLASTESLEELSMALMDHQDLFGVACEVPGLASLHATGNALVSVNETLLLRCSRLVTLDLSRNDIEDMSPSALRSMKRLKNLNLSRNNLRKVPPSVRGLETLETLDLSSNFIGELGCADFQNLTRLATLNLDQNRISTIDGCAFRDLADLRVLNVGANKVHRLEGFSNVNLMKLESLDLHKNNLMRIQTNNFRHLSSLKSLDLESDTSYAVHYGAFNGLDNLQTLVVTPIVYDKMIFRDVNLTGLVDLRLHLTSLYKSRRSNSKNKQQLSEFRSLKRLVIANFEGQQHVPPALLHGLNTLEYFTAARFFTHPIHPHTFNGTSDLKSLQITLSNLEEMNPELFQPIPKLETLDLSQNGLKSLDFLAHVRLPALGCLLLRGNKLTAINVTVFRALPALTYLDLMGNPFVCDCSNAAFVQWAKDNEQTQVAYAYEYDCSFPPAKEGTKLLDMDIESCRMDAGLFCFISTSCLVVLTLFTSFIYHFLRWQLAYAYYLFLAFLYDSRKRKRMAPLRYDAFISYNVHDEAWVYREMLPVLEGEHGFRLCLHHRDFQPGKPIIENITDAIYSSRKTICVISRHYLQSEWCSREIQLASFRLFDEQKDVLVLLFLEDIPSHQLSPYYRMRKVLKRRSYLSWAQAGGHAGLFWQNVHRALESGDADDTDLLTGPEC
ncbi:toll-like receptor 13 [Brachionichthys hirsutus]|uniref:toll-like receptor 13 n=1 Tax=Brachionichthys hirsutus TaxID=412623 RepID=UPI0036051214